MDNLLICFHTCSFTNESKEDLQRIIPFCSNTSKPQWLGQGYYFWTDSEHFAHQWGDVHYSSKYAINKFKITLSKENFFDLVGNVNHQLQFLEYKDNFHKLLDEIIEQPASVKQKAERRQKIAKLKQNGIKVSVIFWALRKLRKINYKVVKAYDIQPSVDNIEYIEKEFISLPTRQQIVVYPEAKNIIEHVSWVHPS